MNRIFTFSLVSLVFVVFNSCNKNTNTETNLHPNLNVANEIVWSQSELRFVFNMIIRAHCDSLLQTTHLAVIDSAIVSYKPTEHKYSFCFTGNMCCDSIHRFGRFEVVSDTCLLVPGSVTTVNFIDYYDESGLFIACTDSIVFSGTDGSGNLLFTERVTDGILLKYLSDTISKELSVSTNISLKISSGGFYNPGSAPFLMSGTSSGISSRGYSFDANFNALENRINCPWFSRGTINFSIKDAAITTGQISFIASDDCNNKIDYDFEGNEYHWTIDPGHLRN